MSEQRFHKGDKVYLVYDNAIWEETVSRAGPAYYDVGWRDGAHRAFGHDDSVAPFTSRRPQKSGYKTLDEAKTALLAQLHAHIAHLDRQANRVSSLISELQTEGYRVP